MEIKPCEVIYYTKTLVMFLLVFSRVEITYGQDYDDTTMAAPSPEQDGCNGIFMTYKLISREKEYPRLKNTSAQSWAFKSQATILNAGDTELKAWKMFIGFQHREILVSASGAVVIDGLDFPTPVGNGTTFSGYPLVDLKDSIDTAGDIHQISTKIEMKGTVFGVKPPSVPMPKTIRLVNNGYKCPKPQLHGTSLMYVCCKKDPKFKVKDTKTKFLPRQNGDLSLTYDVLQAYSNNYLAQVTIDNNHKLGRLDHWNLTWEWMRGEFISTMRGAYTHKKDSSECLFGPAGQTYTDFDFSQVMNCEKKPIIADLPEDRKDDEKVGKLPYCCRNGTLLPSIMDPSRSRAVFQLQVYKLPPDLNRTAFNPPQKWKVTGVLNPDYKCGPPIRVSASEFPDPSGLQLRTTALASWQVVCNITRPKQRETRCCVSLSSYYNDSVIPCNTCACGCENTDKCDPNGQALLLPPEALLTPFSNRSEKTKAWANLNHRSLPKRMPCPDNCGVSINWHLNSDYVSGWTARVTLFNWNDQAFDDWFSAIQFKNSAKGYENIYSFNGTLLPDSKDTIFFQGLKFANYLNGETNGSRLSDPRVPGKQQSVISFSKKDLGPLNIKQGDGFPSRVYFNGEECALPTELPSAKVGHSTSQIGFVSVMTISVVTFIIMTDHFHF